MPNLENCSPIYAMECPSNSAANMAALFGNRNNNQWDNPFIYLVWMMFAQRMWGNDWSNHRDDPQYGYNALSGQISAFQTRMQDNHNADLLFGQIQSNNQDIRAGVDKITSGQALLQQVLCGIEAGIKEVGGKVGFSAERVINAVNVGDCNVIQALKDCCCTTQQNIIRMGYENQLGQKDQMFATQKGFSDLTFGTQAGFDRTNTGLERGFSAVAFQAQQDKCDIIRAGENNTQRIIDTLNTHWKDEQAREILDLKAQISQLKQTDAIIARLSNRGSGCGCENGCSSF